MKRLHKRQARLLLALLMLGMLTAAFRPSAAQASTLFGTIGLNGEDGRFVPGQRLRIYLVTEPIRVEFFDDRTLNRYERIVRVNNAHIDFFKKYREKASRTGYLQSVAESSIAGTFTFRDLPPGRYWVLVTFPSMITGHKVAWQLPVEIGVDDHTWIHLTADNLLLPALSR
jgi:hypothetical protein